MNMHTRASLHHGSVEVISAPGKGCEVNVVFETSLVAI